MESKFSEDRDGVVVCFYNIFITKMPKAHNKTELKPFRGDLRNHSVSAEATLWKILKNKSVGGLTFRRQHTVGKYILDFYCPEMKLAIELDGEFHSNSAALTRDIERDNFLSRFSIQVLRDENRWVFEYPEVITEDILKFKEESMLF